ncbi:nuclear pore complex protein Nup214-like isoform X2 [Photinus pyralis]|uniref:nuclear pore complex protein Nup214-like isoform X2 n=1 Tax=Photinus pyralis TaxID=7054 RepID=UPI001267136B|nr:nuclear pore complex protein Nup214-like isoform X2 [Photinus pyralis]
MAKQAPNPIDVQDFQFKLHCRLNVFTNADNAAFNTPCHLLANSSRFGLIFVGTSSPNFQVIQISAIEKSLQKEVELNEYPRRIITLPSPPKHLSINCDSTKLAVVVEKNGSPFALIYETASFMKQTAVITQEIRLSTTPGVCVTQSMWNPTIPNIFTACKSDGTVGLYELKETGLEIKELPAESQALCICWSPKGKQLAVGSCLGKITQYKPDLKAMKSVNPPPSDGPLAVIAVEWISSFQFIALYKVAGSETCALFVVDAPKVGDVVFTNYEDICYSNGNIRPVQFYTIHQSVWNILLVASSNSMEVGVLGSEKEQWTQWILSDVARAELPLSANKQETLPIGLVLDTSPVDPIIWGEHSLPPAPFLFLLSHYGVLCCFRMINIKSGVSSICQAPESFADNSGLSLFTKAANPVNLKVEAPKQSMPLPSANVQPIIKSTAPSLFKDASSLIAQPLFKDATLPPPPLFKNDSVTTAAFLSKPTLTPAPIISVPQPSIPSTPASKFSTIKPSAPPTSSSETSNTQVSETKALPEETDLLVSKLIREECEILEKELQTLLSKGHSLKIQLGTDSEAVQLVQNADSMQNFLKEVVENSTVQAAEVHSLKQALIQTWAWYEDARSRYTLSQEATLEALLRVEQLDPVSQRRLSNIQYLTYYLESQLIQANRVLDEQWENFQDSCKKTCKLKIPTIETIYQTMVRQNAIHQKQKYVLKDIANRIRTQRRKANGQPLFVSLNHVDQLERDLLQLQLDPQNIMHAQYERVLETQRKLTGNKVRKLGRLLLERDITHISVNKPQLSNTSLQTLLNSSAQIKHKEETTILGADLSPIPTNKWTSPTPQNTNVVQSTPKIVPLTEKKKDEEQKEISPKILIEPSRVSKEDSTTKAVGANSTEPSKPMQSFNFQFSSNTSAVVTSNVPSSTFTFTKPTATAQSKSDTNATSLFQFTPSTTSVMPQFSFSSTSSLPSMSSSTKPFFSSVPSSTTAVESKPLTTTVSSAFVPTTQLSFSFTAKSEAPSLGTNTVKPSPTFNFSAPITGTALSISKVTSPKTPTATTSSATLFKFSSPKTTTVTNTTTGGAIFNFKSPISISAIPTPAAVTVTPVSATAKLPAEPAVSTSAFSFASVTSAPNSVFTFKPSVSQPPAFEFSNVSSDAVKAVTNAQVSLTKATTTTSTSAVTTSVKSIFTPVMTTTADTTTGKEDVAVAVASSSSIFSSITTTASKTTAPTIFGNATVAITTTPSNLFATTVTPATNVTITPTFSSVTTTSSETAAPTSSAPSFPLTAVTESLYGTAVSSTSSVFTPPAFNAAFTQPQATQSSIFAQPTTTVASSPMFGEVATTTTGVFAPQQSGSVFDKPAFGSAPTFGAPAATTTNIFGTPAPSASVFGSNTSIFGNSTTPSTGFAQPSSTFSFSAAAANIPNSDTKFGFSKPAFSFGNTAQGAEGGPFSFNSLNVGAPSTTASTSPMNSAFGQPSNANPFAKNVSQEQKPFGGGSLFGSSPSATSSSIFGGGASAPGGGMFGSPSQPAFGSTPAFGGGAAFGQSPTFGQSNFGSSFGSPQPSSGMFSGGGTQSVAQTGFGAFSQTPQKSTGFGGAPVFGGSPSAGFGAPASFGGAASSFGTPPGAFGGKIFGEAPTTGGAFAGTGQQQNSTFANLASQSTVGFGSLAQQSQPLQNQSPFSNSSFSTWR